jgi:hypothetical protein
MNDAAADIGPTLGVVAVHDHYVGGDAKDAQLAKQANRLPHLVVDVGLDDEEVDIAVGIGLTASMGAEEDHARSRRGRDEAPSGLCDQGFIDDLHRGAS